ncbi:unnamed protein product [Closterium sp. NIES-64]|nr:unnamed protein product [Closterium sp. NIES-64]
MSQEQPRREEMEGQAKVRFSTFFYLPFQHAPIGNPYTIPLSPPPSAIPSLFLLSSPFLLLQQEQFSTEPTQAAAIGAPGYAAGGTAVSAPGYAGGGYVATATGPGFTCTAQEFPTAGGGATGVAAVTDTKGRTIYYSTTMQPMGVTGPGVTETGVTATGVPAMGGGGAMGGGTATGVPAAAGGMGQMGKGTDMSAMGAGIGGERGGDTEMMGGDVGGESIGARGSAEPTGGEKSPATGATAEAGMVRDAGSDVTAGGQVTSAGDIAKAKEAGAAAAGGKTGGAETGGEGFMGRESEARLWKGKEELGRPKVNVKMNMPAMQ